MGSFGVVMDTPLFDQDLGFAQVVEHLTIEQLFAEPGVAGFADKPCAKPIAATNLDHLSVRTKPEYNFSRVISATMSLPFELVRPHG